MSRYRTIVADPPWPVGDFPAWYDESRRSAREREIGHNPTPYLTMSMEEIKALPVGAMADTGGAELYLWTPASFLRAAYDVADAWGFEVACPLVWCKPRFGQGLGGKFPSDVEFVLYCGSVYTDRHGSLVVTRWLLRQLKAAGMTRRSLMEAGGYSEGQLVHWLAGTEAVGAGVPSGQEWARLKGLIGFSDEMDGIVRSINARKGSVPLVRAPGRWFQWPRWKHSTKPEAFLDLVEQVSPGPYLELFARRARFGWDYWGDESLGTAELPEAAA